MPAQNLYAGIASAIAVIFIWSGYIVFSRAGVITSLNAYDITALRFIVAGLIVAPFVWTWWPRHLSWRALALLALCGPGTIYSILMFNGLTEASAAYGGVFANGSLPIFTTLIAYLVARDVPGRMQVLAISVIIFGGLLLGLPGMRGGGANIAIGIAFFLAASAVLSIYIYGIKHWQLTPRQALVLINIPNALIYLPVWYLFLPSGMAEASTNMIVFQALYQGIGPGFLALILFTVAAVNLGPTVTAGFSAVVPASAAVLAIPVLSEFPSPIEWTGIAVVTVGLGLLIIKRS